MPKNKQVVTWSIVGGVLIIAIIIIVVVVQNRHGVKMAPGTQPGQTASEAASPQSPTSTPAKAPAPKGPSSVQYSALVQEYQGKRIEFGPDCQAAPNNITFRNPVTIMLDNRSPKAATIKVGAAVYNLVAWGYRVVTLNSGVLPSTELLDCNSSVNVGQILLQK